MNITIILLSEWITQAIIAYCRLSVAHYEAKSISYGKTQEKKRFLQLL